MSQFTGDATGLPLPATPDELAALGPDWLTAACRAFGSLGPHASVTGLSCTPASGGNSGQKALLDLAWRDPLGAHETHLFVKFSRDFADPFRDRRRGELEAEVRLAQLARHPAFPVEVAQPWFADFHGPSGTGLLITARIAFGDEGIEPLRRKCRDHELADPAEYYRATISALARLAAADLAGRLDPQIDDLFPDDRGLAAAQFPFGWTPASLEDALERIAGLLTEAPQFFPSAVRQPAFIARLSADARLFLAQDQALRAFLHADDRLIALTHWNTNLDNAWFWREQDGALGCGLLDWGMVRRMNVAYGIWGGLSAAEPDMLTVHLDDLLGLYARELAAHGGPSLPAGLLGRHFDLSLALLAMALMLDVPALLRQRMPQLHGLTGARDPSLAADGVVEGFLKVFTNLLVLWEQRDLGRTFRDVLHG